MFAYFLIFLLSVLAYVFVRRTKKPDLSTEHCLITGGSSGIGLALAVECAKLGASITILARSKSRLEAAREIILKARKSDRQEVLIFSVDISNEDASLKDIIAEADRHNGPITSLFNCAGTSVAKRFQDTPLQDFKDMLNVNYFGSVNVTQAVLPYMQKRFNGRIIFVSSLAGLMGLYGYTAYSASKFALVGLAEALQMEVKPYNISITVSFPPDTDTPGYAEEIKHKPVETAKISESGGLFSAEDVARKTLSDVLSKKFMSTVGLEGWFLCTVCCGTTPVNSLLQLFIQVTSMGLLRLGVFTYLVQFDQMVKKCFRERYLPRTEMNQTQNNPDALLTQLNMAGSTD